MSVADRVTELVLPLVEASGLELYDVELNGPTLRITVDGPGGVLLDDLADLTRDFSRALDEADPMPGSYTLEVSSPGLERRLRTPAHFKGAVGEDVNIKLGPHVDGSRRLRGTLQSADDTQVTVLVVPESGDDEAAPVTVDLDDITKAVTVFDWTAPPKPGQGNNSGNGRSGKRSPSPTDDTEKRAGIS